MTLSGHRLTSSLNGKLNYFQTFKRYTFNTVDIFKDIFHIVQIPGFKILGGEIWYLENNFYRSLRKLNYIRQF